MTIIDADTHLFERPDMWTTYTPATDRELALYVTRDDAGYQWLTFRGRRLMLMDVFEAGNWARLGKLRTEMREGLDIAEEDRLENMPASHWEPAARIKLLDELGIDESVLFANFGFMWEGMLAQDLDAVRVNCAAWNRWAVEVKQAGGGRLHPVGQVVLEGGHTPWLEEQMRFLSAGGIRQVMFSPGLIGGVRPSHPDFDSIWHLFVECGIVPTWHIETRMGSVFDHAKSWWDNDRDSHVQLLSILFSPTAAQLALADFVVNGVFHRHPELRLVTAELRADWYPALENKLDRAFGTWSVIHGRPLNDSLDRPPSSYMRDAVLVVCSFPTDLTPDVIRVMDDQPAKFAFGTDLPHPEGIKGLVEYKEAAPNKVPTQHAARFYGDNMAHLLRDPTAVMSDGNGHRQADVQPDVQPLVEEVEPVGGS